MQNRNGLSHRNAGHSISAVLKNLIAATLLVTLVGCTKHAQINSQTNSSPQEQIAIPQMNTGLFSAQQAVIEIEAITRLNPQQRTHFLNYFDAPVNQNTLAHERVANYLGIVLERFQYSEKTLTAESALQTMSGNCLSLVLITDAIAKLSGVNIQYQLLEQNPVYSLEQDLLIRSDHMRSVVNGPWVEGGDGAFRSKRSIRIDYFQTDGLSYVDRIPSSEKDAMYYSNSAVEFTAEKKYSQAFAHAKKALSINPHNLSALNTLGILHRRLGDNVTAEALYRYGSQVHPDKAIFLRNLATIFKSEARLDELMAIQHEIKKLDSNRLIEFIQAGQEADKLRDYDNALLNYQRALAIAPDLHELHFYSAVANYKKGLNGRAEAHFHRAIDQATNDPAKSHYQKKLAALQAN